MKRSLLSLALTLGLIALCGIASSAHANIFSITSPTTSWTVMQYKPGVIADYNQDQQTGVYESDIAGGGILPSFYTHYVPGLTSTTGTVYFRVRLGQDQNPAGFKAACFIGVDANGDGALDLFFGVNNSGQSNGLFIWAPGTGLNISPSTTSIDSQNPLKTYTEDASNYDWQPVTSIIDPSANTNTLLDTNSDGNNDYFLSFAVPFADIVAGLQAQGVNVTSASSLRYVMGTSTQANAFNEDLNGINGGTKSTSSWSSLGIFTLPTTIDGTLVVNTPPVAVDDVARTFSNTPVSLNVLDNDSDPDEDPLSLTSVSPDSLQGTVTSSTTGVVTFTPAPGFFGKATVPYTVSDGKGGESTATLSVDVNGLPVATNDYAYTSDGTPVTIDVLANDVDPEGGSLTIVSGTSAVGSVSIVSNKILFTPPSGIGQARIDYTIQDNLGGVASAVATVYISSTTSTPIVASADSVTVGSGSTALIPVLANDTGTGLSITGITSPAYGTAFVSGTSIQYTAPASFNGLDTFQYTIKDSEGKTAIATVAVHVLPPNQPPVAPDLTATARTNVPKLIPVLAYVSDPDGDAVTLVSGSASYGTATLNGDGTITYTGTAGTPTIVYTVSDSKGATASGTISVTVTDAVPTNYAPVAVNDTATTTMNSSVTIPALLNDSDPNGDLIQIIGINAPQNGSIAPVFHYVNGDFIIDEIKYTPNSGFNGVDSFTYTITDFNGPTSTATVTVLVNAPPTAVTDIASTTPGTQVSLDVLANDKDPDNPLLQLADNANLVIQDASVDPSQGTLAVSTNLGPVNYTPKASISGTFVGTGTALYTILDALSAPAVGEALVNVNRPPVATDDTADVLSGSSVEVPVLTNDTDPDGDPLTVTGALVDSAAGTVTITGTSVIFSPADTATGPVTVTYTITDGHGGFSSAKITIGIDNPPVATDDSASSNGSAVTVSVLDNDTDPDQDPLTVTGATITSGTGSVVFSGTDVTFTPGPTFTGTATVSYSISDGRGGTASANILIDVERAPIATDDVSSSNGTPVTIPVLNNDTDPANNPLSVLSATVPPSQGTITINPDGTITFTPAPGFIGDAVITYTIQNTLGLQSTANVTVHVVNGAPAAPDEIVYTYCEVPIKVNALRNVTDPNLNKVTLVSVKGARHGKIKLLGNGYFLYTPNDSFNTSIEDRIRVVFTDSKGGTSARMIIVKSFDSIHGSFKGDITGTSGKAKQGRVSLSLNSSAGVSGRLTLGDKSYSFSGKLNGPLSFSQSIKLSSKSKVKIVLAYDYLTDTWQATVNGDGYNLSSPAPITRQK